MIALEHTLVMLLLLIGLLNAKPKISKLAWVAMAGALALVLIAPAVPIVLPWTCLSGLIIPMLLWQILQQSAEAHPSIKLKDLAIWSGMVLGISGILLLTSELPAAGSFVFGILAASMVWQAVEKKGLPAHLGQVGPLALAFLLAEIAPAVEAPGRYMVALLAGITIGALVGYVAIQVAQKRGQGWWRNVLSLGQVYLAYGVAVFFNLSGVAAAMMSVVVYVAHGTKRGLWSDGSIRPRPLDSILVFMLAVLTLAFFAWQTHIPMTSLLLVEVSLALSFTALVIWVGRRLGSEQLLHEDSYTRILLRVGFLLVPGTALWPREALLDPLPLIVALSSATLVMIAMHHTLTPLLRIYTWLDEIGTDVENPNQRLNTLLVRDLMDRDCATILKTTPVPAVARLFIETRTECLPVIDAEGYLVGIVTEHDLFVKEERLPRTARTYQTVFKQPIALEQLPQVYAQRGATATASDVMTSKVVWVRETSSIGQAVRLMVQYGFKCLPVLDAAPETDGKLVGVITRSDIVRLLSQVEQSSSHPTPD